MSKNYFLKVIYLFIHSDKVLNKINFQYKLIVLGVILAPFKQYKRGEKFRQIMSFVKNLICIPRIFNQQY